MLDHLLKHTDLRPPVTETKIKVTLVLSPRSPSLEKQPGLSVLNVLPQQPAFKVSVQKCQDDICLQVKGLAQTSPR